MSSDDGHQSRHSSSSGSKKSKKSEDSERLRRSDEKIREEKRKIEFIRKKEDRTAWATLLLVPVLLYKT